jgi:membrane protease YdiL (CAAX protease family)
METDRSSAETASTSTGVLVLEHSTARRGLIAWAVVLFGVTLLGAAALVALGVDPREDFSPVIVLIAYAPALAALCIAGALGGRDAVRALLRQVGRWRVGLLWYALALAGPIVLVAMAHALNGVMGGAPPSQWLPTAAGSGVMLGPLIAGSLGEELGWRGFAQPLLQQRYRAVHASIIIGVLWATWHEWGALAPGGLAHVTTVDLTQSFVRLVSTAIIYGWLYNTTRGSLPVVMVAHAAHNIAVDLMPVPLGGPDDVSLIVAGLYLVAAVGVIAITPTRDHLAGTHASGAAHHDQARRSG